MGDRDLLVLAAKAAGVDVIWKRGMHRGEQREGLFDRSTGIASAWNPLTDDGDALRLAVKLCMNVEVTESDVYACANGNFSESAKPDRAAATRRAIVRAAAEIGKARCDPL